MDNDDGSPVLSGTDVPFIRLDVENRDARRAARLLEAAGGRAISHADGVVYRFLTRIGRDKALDLVRGLYGWTVATPFDDRT